MDFIESAFLKILIMSITASYVIAAILIIRFCFKKAPKVFSYMLWSAAAFRLICPISFSSIFSIFSFRFFDVPAAQSSGSGALGYIPSDIGLMQSPKVIVGIPAASDFISERLPVAAANQIHSVNPMQIITFAAAVIWYAGIVTLVVYSLVSLIRVRRGVSSAVLLEKNIYECDNISSPFVLGLMKPKIYIPFRLSKQEREYILCHEQVHIRRLDHIIKPLSFLMLILHWFNPLVWIAYLCMSHDMEMSCDEKVLSYIGISAKKDYSMSLLSFSARRYFPSAGPLAFGESGVKKRVKNILQSKKPRVWVIAAALILSLGVIAACAANPIGGTRADSTKPKETDDLSASEEADEGNEDYQIIDSSPTEFEGYSQDFQAAFEFGKAFLNDYYSWKAGKGKIDFSKYITNENLLRYSNERMKSENYAMEIEEVSITSFKGSVQPKGPCFYIKYLIEAKVSNFGYFGEPVEVLISNIDDTYVISDWYIRYGTGSSSFDDLRPFAVISDPDIWNDQEFANKLFEKISFFSGIGKSYHGFVNLPAQYTPELAKGDGCYVVEGTKVTAGKQLWSDFIENASNNKDARIRIALFLEDHTSYQDLFYTSGYYHVFNYSPDELNEFEGTKHNVYKHMLILEGTTRNAQRSGKVTILADNNSLTYDDVMDKFAPRNIQEPFEILFVDWE